MAGTHHTLHGGVVLSCQEGVYLEYTVGKFNIINTINVCCIIS